MSLEQRYRRLLRWYPRTWREENGDVLIGTALDAAEAEGRRRPRASEAWTLRLSGLGQRLDSRTALVFALSALALSLLSTVSLLVMNHGSPLIAVASAGIAPTLLTLAACALLRQARVLAPATATLVALVAAAGWTLSLLTQLSWSVGFDEGDAGITRSPFALAFPWMFLAAWCIGGVAAALTVTSVASALPRAARVCVAVVSAVVLPPVLGLGTVSPFTSGVMALALVAVTALRLDRSRISLPALVRQPVPARTRRLVGAFAAVSGLACAAAIVFAFAGSLWISTIDSTRAMQIGIAAGALSLVPLLLGATALLGARYPARRRLMWTGGALFAAGLAASAIPSLLGDTRTAQPNWLASAICGAAIGVIVFATVRCSVPLRVVFALAVAVTYALLLGWSLALYLPFLGPFIALAFAIWGLRTPRRTATSGVALTPQPLRT